MYELNGVTKSYQTKRGMVAALSGVDLRIADGELLAVQGPTGHGKTTLLQMLGGLDRPTAGEVFFDGQDLATLSERRMAEVRARNFGFVFQTFNLVPTLSAAENVETALVPLGVRADERRRRAAETLEEVGLGDRLHHAPTELSGGQQQRVAIARALVKEPKVLLADEPTGNLDEETRDDIIGLIEKLWRERGLTVILVTHDSTVARRAARIAWISKGKLKIRAGDGTRAHGLGAQHLGDEAVGVGEVREDHRGSGRLEVGRREMTGGDRHDAGARVAGGRDVVRACLQ
jgi:putative ABC transport system ATP-binding protein